MDDMKKAGRKIRLDNARVRGTHAETTLKTIEPALANLEQQYRCELVVNTRKNGEIHAPSVWKLVNLDDLVIDLERAISGGRIAERKLKQIDNSEVS